ncbi:hypothetical protein GQ54DRAFT_270511 [Martensiomyces pterosporus]|nr:hypothetical protein GQ54DRAFT_270511 [Martensiomyces pterosporus]
MAGSHSPQQPLTTIPLLKSCESCRQRKIKCSGDKPTCAHCARRHQPCIYRRSARYKRRLNGVALAAETGANDDAAEDTEAAAATAVSAALGGTNSTPNGGAPPTANAIGSQQQKSQPVPPPPPPLLAVQTNGQQHPSREPSLDENIPLAAFFGTMPINESDILPPSILQSMNFWMNDSLLTEPTTPSTAALPAAMSAAKPIPAMESVAKSAAIAPSASITMQQQQQQQQQNNMSLLNNLIPMDVALGLPPFINPISPSSDAGITMAGPSTNPLAALSSAHPSCASAFGFSPDFMQQLSQMQSLQIAPSSDSPYTSASMHSPLSAASPNPLLGQPDVNSLLPFPTSAFASLNLLSSLDSQRQRQRQPQQLQSRTPSVSSNVAALFSTAAISPASTNAIAPGGLLKSATAPPFTGNILQQAQTAALTAMTPSSSSGPHQIPMSNIPVLPNADGSNKRLESALNKIKASGLSYVSNSAASQASANHPISVDTVGITQPRARTTSVSMQMVDSPIEPPLDSAAASSTHNGLFSGIPPLSPLHAQARLSVDSAAHSVITSASNASSVPQMNNDTIPQMLKDIVQEHPELGSAELIYNLLITHVVHDCSRLAIYSARLFWLRVKEYKLAKYHLLAAIADASRSWTLPDSLRSALPQNIDETCYELAMRDAPTTPNNPSVVAVTALLVMASYEFKSARFAPMLEHNCLAFKMITQVKFRGAPFPWRGAKKIKDANGLDCNYQLLLRVFWRLYMVMYFSTEIFRIDAPEDRDFLPEMPERDDYFAQHVFVPDETAEFGFKMVPPPYDVPHNDRGDLMSILCELYIKQYKMANRFNRILRGEKTALSYITYLQEWDRQMLEWRDNLPQYLRDDLTELARHTQPLDVRRRRMNLEGLSEDEMWQKRHQWNRDVGRTMEVLYVHMMFDMSRLKAHRIALMLLLHEDLDMVRNFQCSKAFALQELPRLANTAPVSQSFEEDSEYFKRSAEAANSSASHVYDLLKFNYQFGFDLHAYTTLIISTLLQVGLVYVGRVQSSYPNLAWCAMLRLARILAMIRSLERWGPALYIFTNILKALGRPELILQVPSPQTRAELAANTRKPAAVASQGSRSMSVDSATTGDSCADNSCCYPQLHLSPGIAALDGSGNSTGKRKSCAGGGGEDGHGDEKRYEFHDHHHGDPHSVSGGPMDSPTTGSEDEDVTNPFPHDHVISHIMREQKVSTATFFSPTLPILAASLLHTNSGI